MHCSGTPACGLWPELLTVITVGVVVIVSLAALLVRSLRAPVWQRTVWQGATLGLLVLFVVEMSGGGAALVELTRASMRRPAVQAELPRGADHPTSAEIAAASAPLGEREATVRGGDGLLVSPGDGLPQHGLASGRWLPTLHSKMDRAPASPDVGASAWPERESTLEGEPSLLLTMPSGLGHGSQTGRSAPPASRAVANETSPSRRAVIPGSAEVASGPSSASARLSADDASPPQSRPWLWPGVIWILGAVLLGARFAWARLLLFRFRQRHAAIPEAALVRRVDALARRLGIRRPVTVLEAAGLTTPVAFGCLRPTLALPTTFCGQFDRREQEAVIVHELAHLGARDPAWQAMADVACAVLWWHPLAWWSRRRLRSASEAAADEASRLLPEGADVLASCLIALGRRLSGAHPRLGWLSMGGPGFRSGLGRRVERLLRSSNGPWRAPRRGPLALAKATLPGTLVIVAVLSTAWAHPRATLIEGGTPMNVLESSWRRSLAAAALVALLAPISGDTMAQEEREKEVPKLSEEERPAEEARRERDAPEARERERGERERGEREEGQREGGEREALMHQLEVLRLALPALREAERGEAIELVERAIRAREVTLEGRRDDEAHMIREQSPGPGDLAEILGMAAGLWREFGSQDKAQAVAELADVLRAPRDREPERPRRDREREEGERRPPAERDERVQQLKREYEELKEKAQRIEVQLRERPGDEQARELQGAAREVQERMGDVERQIAEIFADRQRREREEGRREGAERERAELERRFDELMAAHGRAREAGRPDEAERLLREAEEIKRRFERPERDMPPPEQREEMERRMQHVRVAVENLHAAGLHEQAEQLARDMERMLHGRPGPPRPGLEPPPRGEGPPPAERLEGVLRELHEAVQQLNQRMDEMNRNVEREIQAIRRDVEAMGRQRGEERER